MSEIEKPSLLTRREFIKLGLATGSGLILSIPLDIRAENQGNKIKSSGSDFSPSAYLSITSDNSITFFIPEIEMGQGINTSLAMLIAEELEVEFQKILIKTPDTSSSIGPIGTSGSLSIRENWKKLRIAGASAREMLIAAAAKNWNVTKSECKAELGKVWHKKSEQYLTYGELADWARQMTVPEIIELKKPNTYKLIGKSTLDHEAINKTTGKSVYGMDINLPGMLIAVVVRCPELSGRIISHDSSKALMVHGVKHIVQIKSGIAVVADTFWAAKKGASLLNIKIMPAPPDALKDSHEINVRYRAALEFQGDIIQKVGEPLSTSGSKIQAIFELPFLAHATMEPMNCTAQVTDDLCEVWAPTQNTYGAQYESALYYYSSFKKRYRNIKGKLGFKNNYDDILVHPTMIGGGFGRRIKQDYVAEAVQISKSINKPVKLIWTREDDMQFGYFRPYTAHKVTAHLDEKGLPTSWFHHIVGSDKGKCIGGSTDFPYSINSKEISYTNIPTVVPIGSWRSVGHSHNIFVVETFIDMLATQSSFDPLDYRLNLLTHEPRCKQVLITAANIANWKNKNNHHMGIALTKAYGSYVAQVADISITDNQLHIHKIVCVADCGQIVHPDNVKGQIEGGIIFALSAALKGEITIKNGKIEQSNFSDYPVLKINEVPHIEVRLINNTEHPGGVGELAVPPLAAALANAIRSATGKAVSRLPIRI